MPFNEVIRNVCEVAAQRPPQPVIGAHAIAKPEAAAQRPFGPIASGFLHDSELSFESSPYAAPAFCA